MTRRGSRIKVAFVHQPWSIVRPGDVGADSVVLWTEQVSRRLARRCDVLCYSRLGDGLAEVERVEGVEHRRVSAPIDRYLKFAFRKLDQWGLRNAKHPFFASPYAYRQFIMQVAGDLRRQKVDVVHIHNSSQFVPILRSRLPNAKIALHMHCEWLTQLDRIVVASRIQSADLVIGVSDFLTAKIRSRFDEYADRIRRVYNGADIERFVVSDGSSRDGNGKTILYIGRVSPEKGIHTLLDAFAIIARHRDDVHLKIVGPERIVPYEMIVPFCDDPKVLELSAWFRGRGYCEHLRRQIASLPRDRVEWIDREIMHNELPEHYAHADVFAFPSIWDEPFGMPLVEAMSAGLPAVATRGGAFPEIVQDGKTGLLVDRADPQALADALSRLCADDALRREMGQASQQRARSHFSWDHVSQSLLREYERIIDVPAIDHEEHAQTARAT